MLKFINQFIQSLNLKENKPILVGLSGGIDSMSLAFVLNKLNYNIKAVHINHQNRNDNILDENLVKSFCKENNIPLDIYHFNYKKGNFELEARNFRYNIFKKYPNHYIMTAHHIDDSFEWHLMQKFKTSSGNDYGIPVINKNIIRPFMCLSKTHILKLAKKYQIPYNEDPTNKLDSYERNFVRNNIVPQIKKQYPKYLSHYVNQMNILTKEKGIHYTQERKTNKSKKIARDSSFLEIQEAIKNVSNKKRGKLAKNIIKMQKTIKKGNKNFSMDFSGKTRALVTKDHILIKKVK